MDYSRPALADRLAAEYVAGTLRGAARKRFEALLPAHAGLRRAVIAWQDRLVPLSTSIAPQSPPARVWQRIEARLNGTSSAPRASGLWSQLAFWRGLTALGAVAALSLAVLLATPGPAQAPVVIVLNATGTSANGAVVPASFVAGISGDGRAVVTRPLSNVALRPDRSLELWALPPSGAPRSLGVISSEDATVVRKPQVFSGAAALAVTLEPRGGSPSGAPTGPVLFVGKLQS
jgi:anti-sigma-K factor RskA